MKGISHLAIGVSDMERSLPFYRDLLGLEVMLDNEEQVGQGKRRAVYMRWNSGGGFLVLSQTLGREPSGKPLRLHQVGMHHFAFLVDDLRARLDRLKNAGVKILVPPYEADSLAYGEKGGAKVLTCLFEDPDGTILQFDQRTA
ncbi:MAG TPA: VOC family protein [Candidatus Binataceae bacterium]|jgi:catechol 2,3-dioxygenase-like lactoylglutathione lyase family enzyme|nr:VOC family protein [Candidatus Binataceae bacterium]